MLVKVSPLLVVVILVLVPGGALITISSDAPTCRDAQNCENNEIVSEKAVNTADSPDYRMTIFPYDNIVMYKGRLQYFFARLLNSLDENVAGAALKWRISDGALGAITSTGIFIAGNSSGVCTVNVTCSIGGTEYGNSTRITIMPVHPAMTELVLAPSNFTIKRCDSSYVYAQAYNGSAAMGGVDYGWSSENWQGEYTATPCPQVLLLSPQKVRQEILNAACFYNETGSVKSNITSHLAIRVVWGVRLIVITSTSHELTPNITQEFNATAYDVDDDGTKTVRNGVLFRWALESLSPPGICTIDTEYGSSTNITATGYGNGTITASADEILGRAGFTVPTPDETAPVIAHTQVNSASQGEQVMIRVDVYDESGIGYVSLWYKSGKNDWMFLKMKQVKNEFTAYYENISGEAVVQGGVDYYIETRDAYGNAAFSPDMGRSKPYHIDVEEKKSIFSTPEFWLGVISSVLIIASITVFAAIRWQRKSRGRAKKAVVSKTPVKNIGEKPEKDVKNTKKGKSKL